MAEVKRRRRRTRKELEAARRRRESSRAYHLRTKHRMTPEQYEELLAFQGGVCYLCGKAPVKVKLSVDHDHKIAREQCDHPHEESCQRCWRGLLHRRCNGTLAHARDDPMFFVRGNTYLQDPPAQRWMNDRESS